MRNKGIGNKKYQRQAIGVETLAVETLVVETLEVETLGTKSLWDLTFGDGILDMEIRR